MFCKIVAKVARFHHILCALKYTLVTCTLSHTEKFSLLSSVFIFPKSVVLWNKVPADLVLVPDLASFITRVFLWRSITMLVVRAFQCTIVELMIIGTGTNLSVCQRMDEFELPTIRYKVFCDRNGNKVKCNIV